jgi:hypothetical protein
VENPRGEFTSIMPMANALWLIGPVLDGDNFSISFDLQLTTPEGAYSLFGIHEYPTVPEPATLALAGCALAAARRPDRTGLRTSTDLEGRAFPSLARPASESGPAPARREGVSA